MRICDAIREPEPIAFDYGGHHRIVHPAAFGTHITTGNPALRGYQVGGTGSSRAVPFWDLFLLSKIQSLRVLEGHFVDDPPGYKKGDKHLRVQCEL